MSQLTGIGFRKRLNHPTSLLGLTRLLLHAGPASQATLSGGARGNDRMPYVTSVGRTQIGLCALFRMATAQPKSAEQAVKRTAHEVARQSRNVSDQAVETKHAAAAIEVSADLNTRLAADRNILAAERTYAAWVRTGLFALASGIGARALLAGVLPPWAVMVDASVLIAFSIFCFGAAIWRELNPGLPPPAAQLAQIPRPVLIALNGFLALVSLAALIGIWFGAPLATAGAHVPPA